MNRDDPRAAGSRPPLSAAFTLKVAHKQTWASERRRGAPNPSSRPTRTTRVSRSSSRVVEPVRGDQALDVAPASPPARRVRAIPTPTSTTLRRCCLAKCDGENRLDRPRVVARVRSDASIVTVTPMLGTAGFSALARRIDRAVVCSPSRVARRRARAFGLTETRVILFVALHR